MMKHWWNFVFLTASQPHMTVKQNGYWPRCYPCFHQENHCGSLLPVTKLAVMPVPDIWLQMGSSLSSYTLFGSTFSKHLFFHFSMGAIGRSHNWLCLQLKMFCQHTCRFLKEVYRENAFGLLGHFKRQMATGKNWMQDWVLSSYPVLCYIHEHDRLWLLTPDFTAGN